MQCFSGSIASHRRSSCAFQLIKCSMIEVLSRKRRALQTCGQILPQGNLLDLCMHAGKAQKTVHRFRCRSECSADNSCDRKWHRNCVLLFLCLSEFSRRFCVPEFPSWKALTASYNSKVFDRLVFFRLPCVVREPSMQLAFAGLFCTIYANPANKLETRIFDS